MNSVPAAAAGWCPAVGFKYDRASFPGRATSSSRRVAGGLDRNGTRKSDSHAGRTLPAVLAHEVLQLADVRGKEPDAVRKFFRRHLIFVQRPPEGFLVVADPLNLRAGGVGGV